MKKLMGGMGMSMAWPWVTRSMGPYHFRSKYGLCLQLKITWHKKQQPNVTSQSRLLCSDSKVVSIFDLSTHPRLPPWSQPSYLMFVGCQPYLACDCLASVNHQTHLACDDSSDPSWSHSHYLDECVF